MKKKIQQFIIASCLFVPSVNGQDLQEVVTENFDDNTLSWEIYNGSEYKNSSTIQGGKYILTNSSTENNAYFVNTRDYDVEKPFTIEAQLKFNKTDGSIVFLTNFEDWDSPFYGLGIRGDVAAPVFHNGNQYANGGAYEKYIKNSDFKQKGNSIKLKVECKLIDDGPYNHQEMTYYVNGIEIAVDDNSHMFESMKKFGFQLTGNTEIEVDYIKIQGTPIVKELPNVTQVSTSPLGTSASGSTEIKTIMAGEAIYAKVFMNESFLETVGSGYNINISEHISIDGESASVYEWTMDYSSVSSQGSSYDIEMAPKTGDLNYPQEAYTLTKKLIGLAPGKHNVKLTVVYQLQGISAANTLGEVTFTFDNTSESGRAKFKNMVEAYRSQALKNVQMPSAGMSNSIIEKSVKDAIVKAGWNETPTQVVIMDRDWGTLTHEVYGTILQRKINVAIAVKDQNGFCRIFYPTVFQKHLGGGKYSTETTLGGMHKIEEDIDCGNVN